MKTEFTLAEQKAIILDCLEKNACIHQTIAKHFPFTQSKVSFHKTPLEQAVMDACHTHSVGMSNSLSDIYGLLTGEEVNHG